MPHEPEDVPAARIGHAWASSGGYYRDPITDGARTSPPSPAPIVPPADGDPTRLYRLADRRRSSATPRRGPRARHDLYAEVASARTYYRYVPGEDPTGVFSAHESPRRLFDERPPFDNGATYGLEDDISPLVDAYFTPGDRMLSDSRGYGEEILDTASRLRPLDPQIKAVLVIPAYQEGDIIARTLQRYSSCAGMSRVAILVLENLPVGARRDQTLSQIELFRRRRPDVALYHVYKPFAEKMPIGYIRKYAADLAIRIKHRAASRDNFVLVGGDADCVDVNRSFFASILGAFHDNESLDAVELGMDVPLSYRTAFPTQWVMQRLFDFSWMYMRRRINPNRSIRMYGPASAIKCSSYLMIKGFNPRTNLCEDLQLGWLLDEARRSAAPAGGFFDYLGRARIVTSPRRTLGACLSNVAHLDIYDSFYEEESIRRCRWEDLVDRYGDHTLNVGSELTAQETRDAIVRTRRTKADPVTRCLAYALQRYVDWWQSKVLQSMWLAQADFEDMLRRVLRAIGIRYRLDTTGEHWSIRILDVEQLRRNIDAVTRRASAHHGPEA